MNPLDPVNIALSGVHLIEASAGTGKTYTITGLYLRLLLEGDLSPENILVVTFTEAACRELRDGIRRRLVAAQQAFAAGRSDDAFLQGLVTHYRQEGKDLANLRDRTALALMDFDLASIFTIHGFCMRVLQDSAFESGHLFETEFVESDAAILEQVVDDYWRRRAPGWPDAVKDFFLAQNFTPDSLGWLSEILRKLRASSGDMLQFPEVQSIADFDSTMVPELVRLWGQERQTIAALLDNGKVLNNPYTAENIADWIALLDRFAASKGSLPLPVEAIIHLGRSNLQSKTKKAKAGETPEHEFFVLCERLHDQLLRIYAGQRAELIWHCLREVAAVKMAGGMVSFDDLLTGVRDGLSEASFGPHLAARVVRQYPVALIDEFQDTDPVQYEVFQRIYIQGSGEALFLVGDPKQAIYGFRGADIYAYHAASRLDTAAHHTLATNWRSVPGLIAACNLLFGRHPHPFVLPEIVFEPVQHPERPSARFVAADCDPAPLQITTFSDQENREQAKKRVAEWTARAVARLLAQAAAGQASFVESDGTGRKLQAADIAILVRKHKEGELVRQSLAACGVHAVIQSRDSVFQSAEARELQRLLEAVACCDDERLVRAALAGRFMGLTAPDLILLEESEEAWSDLLARFAVYKNMWQQRGVAPMLYTFFAAEHSFVGLAKQQGGERALTNIRHLIELLQDAAHTDNLSLDGLIQWLKERRHQDEGGEANQLRLESDENLVQIVTVHKSKGLQYPLVFCPFLWDSSFLNNQKKDFVICHEEDRAVVDFGTEHFDRRQLAAQKEELAEELRLLYVAVTRAMHRCFLYWGAVKSRHSVATATSALQYLLTPDLALGSDVLASLKAHFKETLVEEQLVRLRRLADDSQGAIAVGPVPAIDLQGVQPPAAERPLLAEAGVFSRSLNTQLGIRSFSSLHQSHDSFSEEPDHDAGILHEEPAAAVLPVDAWSVFAFPRGTQAGSCLHAILEQYDFQGSDQAAGDGVIAEKLELFGFDRQWLPTVRAWLAAVVAAELFDGKGTLSLAAIPRNARLDELEFYYAIPALQEEALREIFLCEAGSAKQASDEVQIYAFMKGFVDLIFQWQGRFYIVDYKSNYLGSDLADYQAEHLRRAMVRSGYDLQYHIYIVALHRYLQSRLAGYDYERHFGGVFYLFLRGMQPGAGSGSGVFFHRPAWEKIQILDATLRSKGQG